MKKSTLCQAQDQEERRLSYNEVCKLLLTYKADALGWEAAFDRLLGIHLRVLKAFEKNPKTYFSQTPSPEWPSLLP